MKGTSNEKLLTKKVWLNSLKLFGKIVLAVFFVYFYTIAALFVFVPKFDAKIFKFFGMKKAEEVCYVRIYEKSGSNADLYNLILIESELGNDEKELYYLNILLNSNEYEEFYKKLDNSALQFVEDKSLVAYSCNTNAYLINQKIKTMYNLGFDNGASLTVKNYVKVQLESEFLFDSAFATYVDLVNNDETLTMEQKIKKIEMLFSSSDVALTKRLNALNEYTKKSDITLANKIIAQNAIVNIRRAVYTIEKLNNSENLEVSKTNFEQALKVYNELIK